MNCKWTLGLLLMCGVAQADNNAKEINVSDMYQALQSGVPDGTGLFSGKCSVRHIGLVAPEVSSEHPLALVRSPRLAFTLDKSLGSIQTRIDVAVYGQSFQDVKSNRTVSLREIQHSGRPAMIFEQTINYNMPEMNDLLDEERKLEREQIGVPMSDRLTVIYDVEYKIVHYIESQHSNWNPKFYKHIICGQR